MGKTAVQTTPAAATDIIAAINRKQDIQGCLERTRDRRSRAKGKQEQLAREIVEMDQALSGLKAAASSNPRDVALVEKQEKALKQKRLEIGKVNSSLRELDLLIHQFEATLRSCETAATLQDVLDHQTQVSAASRAVNGLRSAIAEEQAAIDAALDAMPAPSSLYREREDLLAAIALKKAKTEDLAALDAKILVEEKAATKAAHEVGRRAATSRQALVGLNRKLDAALKQLEQLRAYTPEILRRFLSAEAEKAYVEYVKAAVAVKKYFLQIVALDALIKRHTGGDGRPSLLGDSCRRFYIPLFALPQSEVSENAMWPGTLFSAEMAGAESESVRSKISHAIGIETDRLQQGLGVILNHACPASAEVEQSQAAMHRDLRD